MTDDEAAREPEADVATDTSDPEAGSGQVSTTSRSAVGGLLANRGLLIALVGAGVAFIAAAVFGVLWWSTATSDEYRIADARDDAVTVARGGIEAYSVIDYNDPDKFRERRRELATPELFEAEEKIWDNWREDFVENEMSISIDIHDVAIHELNVHEGSANAIAAIERTLTYGDQKDTLAMGVYVRMQRLEGDWKIAEISPLP